LEKEELIKDNPFAKLNPPKIENKVIQALTPAEIDRLFNACSGKSPIDIRNKAILSMFLDTGLRVSELASLNIDDMDMNTGSIVVRHGKGGKQRVVHIGSKAQKALWKYITIYRRSESKSLFINRSGEPLEVIGIKILIKRLGISARVKVSPHKLRHTFAISYLRAGGDVFSLQYLLGHSTLQMTQRYLQSLNADDAINAHRKFSPLDNMK
jgi:site-specific recombinase XerD